MKKGLFTALAVCAAAACGGRTTPSQYGDDNGAVRVQMHAATPGGTPMGEIIIQNVFDPGQTRLLQCVAKPELLDGLAFCDEMSVLPPGVYEIKFESQTGCSMTQDHYKVVVQAGQTTEIRIDLVCGPLTGGLDVVVTESHFPQIDNIRFNFGSPEGPAANKFICATGAPVAVTFTIQDAETACTDLTAQWSLNGAIVTPAPGTLIASGDTQGVSHPDGTCTVTEVVDPSVIDLAQLPYDATLDLRLSDGTLTTTFSYPIHVIACGVLTIPTGGKSPEGIALNPVTHRVFIEAEPEDNGGVDDDVVAQAADPYAIYEFDPLTLQLVAVTPVHDEGEYLAVNPATNLVYHANMETHEVAVIDASTHEVLTYVSLSFADGAWQPEGIAVDVAQNLIYVGAKAPPLGEVPAGGVIPSWCKGIPEPTESEPAYECWNPGRIFVIDGMTNTLALAADGTPLSFLAGDDPESIVFAAATNKVYSANEDDGTITVALGAQRTPGGIVGPQVLSTISGGVAVPGWMEPVCAANGVCEPLIPLWPSQSACAATGWEKAQEADKMAVDPLGNVYITDDKYRVAKIDGQTGAVLKVLDIPGYACPNPVNGLLGPNTANNIAVMSGNGLRLYVVSEQDTVALVDPVTMTLDAILTVPGAKHLDAVATDGSLNRVYITDEELNALFILQGNCASGLPGGCI